MNEKLAAGSFDGSVGCAVIVVSGEVVSTVQVKLAGVGSVLPAASIASTANVCVPSVRPESVRGDEQAPYGAPSSEHWNDEPGSDDANEKLDEPLDGSDGCAVIVVSGGVLSIVTVALADVPVFPASSVTRAATS